MSSTRLNEIKQLFRETQFRYPSQPLPPETQAAWLEDWREMCAAVGLQRFTQGVKRARASSDFFPSPARIAEMVPVVRDDNAEIQRELRELVKRKAAGENFYSLADVLLEFRRKVETGEVKGRDERGQKALESWAKALRNSEKEYAAKMLGESGRKRPKSDLQDLAGQRSKP